MSILYIWRNITWSFVARIMAVFVSTTPGSWGFGMGQLRTHFSLARRVVPNINNALPILKTLTTNLRKKNTEKPLHGWDTFLYIFLFLFLLGLSKCHYAKCLRWWRLRSFRWCCCPTSKRMHHVISTLDASFHCEKWDLRSLMLELNKLKRTHALWCIMFERIYRTCTD